MAQQASKLDERDLRAPSTDEVQQSVTSVTAANVTKDEKDVNKKMPETPTPVGNAASTDISEDDVLIDVCNTGRDVQRQPSTLSLISPASSGHSAVVLLERYPFLSSARRADADVDYNKLISQQRWLPHQGVLFQRALQVLEASYLARIAHHDTDKLSGHTPHEATLVSLHTSKSAEKLRGIFAEINWDKELLPWLNAMLLDFLDRTLLEEYIDILRHLRLKCRDLMDARGLLDGRGSRRLGGNGVLRQTLAKPPSYMDVTNVPATTWTFPVEPVIVLGPGEHSWASSSHLAGYSNTTDATPRCVLCLFLIMHSSNSSFSDHMFARKRTGKSCLLHGLRSTLKKHLHSSIETE
eukprot:m.406417 g.406417  ORF g.406417 m.406417 type:complete len:353 (+) comp21214_c0_seq1:162-1220(+)